MSHFQLSSIIWDYADKSCRISKNIVSQVFSALYSRWDDGCLPRESVEEAVAASDEHVQVGICIIIIILVFVSI